MATSNPIYFTQNNSHLYTQIPEKGNETFNFIFSTESKTIKAWIANQNNRSPIEIKEKNLPSEFKLIKDPLTFRFFLSNNSASTYNTANGCVGLQFSKRSKNPFDNKENAEKSLETLEEKLKQHFSKKIADEIDLHLKQAFNKSDQKALAKFQKKLDLFLNENTTCSLSEFIISLAKLLPLSKDTLDEAVTLNSKLEDLEEIFEDLNSKNWVAELGLKKAMLVRKEHLTKIATPDDVICVDKKLIIHSHHPKTSQVKAWLKQSTQPIKEIEIYGLDTVTIDEDLDGPKMSGVNVTIIAPKWEIIRSRQIVLNGINSTHSYTEKAADGTTSGAHGAPGSPGHPGTSAGHFFGLGLSFTGLDNLSIEANGGNGSKGQDGGDGHAGDNGPHGIQETMGNVPAKENCGRRPEWDHVDGDTHINYGREGAAGGNSGAGGEGGFGGFKGTGELISLLDPTSKLNLKSAQGENGKSGNDGTIGIGGLKGWDWKGAYVWSKGIWHAGYRPKYIQTNIRASNGTAPTQKNKVNQLQSAVIPPINTNLHFLRFKWYAILAMNEITTESLETFISDYEKNPLVREKASVENFIEECCAIEDLYTEAKDKLKCIPLYQSVLKRMKDFQSKPLSTEETAKLNYLCAHSLSKICQINASSKTRFVTDIDSYLDIVSLNLDEVCSLDKKRMVDLYKRDYELQILAEANKSSIYINLLKDELKSAHTQVDKAVNILIQEIKLMIQNSHHEKAELEAKKRKLEAEMQKKNILTAISTAIQCIGCCLPPAGPIIAGIVNVGMNMVVNPGMSETEAAMEGASIAGNVYAFCNLDELGKSEFYKNSNFNNVRGAMSAAGTLAESAKRLMAENKANKETLEKIEHSISTINENIAGLNQIKDTVPDSKKNLLHSIVDDVLALQKRLEEGGLIGRDYNRFLVRKLFERFKVKVTDSVKIFGQSNNNMLAIIQNLEAVIETSMNIYDRKQDYIDRIVLANYMAKLASPETETKDARLRDLYLKAKSNVVLELYIQAVYSIRQWAFPFSSLFLTEFYDLGEFQKLSNDPDSVLVKIKKRVSDLRTSIKSHFAQALGELDESIVHTNFSMPEMPFYKWTGKDHSKKTADFLSGKSVVLVADVQHSPKVGDAIKFSEIAIQLKCKDPTLQKKFDDIHKHYKVHLHHSGNSRYRFKGNFYSIGNNSGIVITRGFDQNDDSKGHVNDVYKKLEKGDFVLSPYTEWTLRLEKVSGGPKFDVYELLKNAIPELEICLVGKGRYIDSNLTKSLDFDFENTPRADFSAKPSKAKELKKFKVGSDLYVRQNTLGDGSCALHALIGEDINGTYTYKNGNPKLEFSTRLTKALDSGNQEIKRLFQKNLFELLYAYTQGNDRSALEIFNNVHQQVVKLINDTQTLSNNIKELRCHEAKAWAQHLPQGLIQYPRFKGKTQEEISIIFRDNPESVWDFIYEENTLFSEFLEKNPNKEIQEIRQKIKDVIAQKDRLHLNFINSKDIKDCYFKALETDRYYLNTCEIQIGAFLFNKKVTVFTEQGTTYTPVDNEVPYNRNGTEEVFIFQSNEHFERCIKSGHA